MDTEPKRLEDVIAANVRRRREELDLLQEELAREVRLMGPKWSYTTVVRLERGQREPSLREVLALAVALQMPLSQLLAGGHGTVQLRPGVAAKLSALRQNIAADKPPVERSDLRLQDSIDASHVGMEAEDHAARRVGRHLSEVREAADALWGRSYSQEREHRLQELLAEGRPDPETRRAQRGHVSRRLLAELRQYFADQERQPNDQ